MTLIELMVAITVLAIIMAFAIPSYRDAALNSKLVSISSSLYASAQLSRGEAIKRNQIVRMCASSDGSTCTGDWKDGWLVLDVDDNVLQRQDAIDDGFEISEAADLATVNFNPIGAGADAATFTVCRAEPVGNQERVVSITATGMPYVTRTETGSCP